jgi:hypothetical protein
MEYSHNNPHMRKDQESGKSRFGACEPSLWRWSAISTRMAPSGGEGEHQDHVQLSTPRPSSSGLVTIRELEPELMGPLVRDCPPLNTALSLVVCE